MIDRQTQRQQGVLQAQAARRRQDRVNRVETVMRYLAQLYQSLNQLRGEADEVKLVQALGLAAAGLRQAADRLDQSPRRSQPPGPPPGGYRVQDPGASG